MDEDALERVMESMLRHMTGAVTCFGVWLGEEVGLYRALASAGPLTAAEVALRAGAHPLLVREWLDGQAAAGLLGHDPARGTYTLSAEAALVLADDTSPVFLARALRAVGSMYIDVEAIAAAFRGDGRLPWAEHHRCLYSGVEWSLRTGYEALLATEWIPAMVGMEAKLSAGATVADVGCGHGAATVVLAQHYPRSQIWGFDSHRPSVEVAGKRAAEAGVHDRAAFATAAADAYPGTYDLICFFNSLHDMGDPVGAARHARGHLAVGGSVLLVEPFALDGPGNLTDNPIAAMLYTASAAICTPSALAQTGGVAIGAQAGPARLAEILHEAGFARVDHLASTSTSLVIHARS